MISVRCWRKLLKEMEWSRISKVYTAKRQNIPAKVRRITKGGLWNAESPANPEVVDMVQSCCVIA